MKHNIILITLILFIALVSSCKQNGVSVEKEKVSIVFPVTIDAFDQLRNGFELVCKDSFDTRYFSAEGDPDKFETIIQSALLTKPDYLVTIGSQITNTAFGPKFKNNLPIVIASAISFPDKIDAFVNVGVHPRRKAPVAIISDNPKENIYDLFAKSLVAFIPKIKKVGILYNTSEINSVETANKIKEKLNYMRIDVLEGVINNIEDVEKVTNKLLLGGAKVIIIPHDKYAVTKATSIVKISTEKNVPVFSLDDGTVKKDGVSIGISVNYKTVGKMIGQTLLKIASHQVKAEDLPIVQLESAGIYVNQNSLNKLGIKIPKEFMNIIVRY